MLSEKLLLRLAQRLQKAWQGLPDNLDRDLCYILDRLRRDQQCFEETRALLTKAKSHGLFLVLPNLHEQLLGQAGAIEEDLSKIRRLIGQPPLEVPSLSCLVAELRQLEEEFGEVTVDWNGQMLSVQTDPINLEGIPLASFAIQLQWQHLVHRCRGDCFEIVALDPNPAASNDHVTHPHVKNGSLCAGDATVPLERALKEGRLADAFCLIRGVLLHYNPHSPFVPLEEWGGTACQDCGISVVNEDRYFCDRCENDFCSECMNFCSVCEASRCSGCLERCAVCDAYRCPGCLKTSDHSDRLCCPACMRECPTCGASVARDEINPDTDLCPSCSTVEETDDYSPTSSEEPHHAEPCQPAEAATP